MVENVKLAPSVKLNDGNEFPMSKIIINNIIK